MTRYHRSFAAIAFALAVLAGVARAEAPADPLPSWNDRPVKQAIVQFVQSVTDKSSSQYVPPAERIAAFDNDGTLWCEQPMYTQQVFAFDRIRMLAARHPEWQNKPPYKAVMDNDAAGMAKVGLRDMLEMVEVAHAGMTPEEFAKVARDWLATARHPRFRRPYTELVYQPMLELLAYLRANGFKTYIVSGAGLEFMRPWTEQVYGIPPEQVIGSYGKVTLAERDGKPELLRQAEVAGLINHADKAIALYQVVGRRPILVFGNSDGDLEMLEWAAAGKGARFVALVHHTDADREYAYDRDTRFGTLNKGLGIAEDRKWSVVDMKADWNRVFPEVRK